MATEITWKQLQANDGSTGKSWTAVRGTVYDLTSFLNSHPGGDVIRLSVARDATSLVESYHPPGASERKVQAVLSKLPVVGKLQQHKKGMDYSHLSEFRTTVRERCAKELEKRGRQWRGSTFLMGLETIGLMCAWLSCLTVMALTGSSLAAFVCGMIGVRMGFLMHCGNHQSESSSQLINGIASSCMDVLGILSHTWRWEHQVAHHCTPNELGMDNDCEIAFPIFRLHPGLKRFWWQRFQNVTLLIAISVGMIKWVLFDGIDFAKGTIGNVSIDKKQPKDYMWVIISKTLFFLLPYGTCFYLHGFWTTLFNFVLIYSLAGQVVENTFVVNHIQPHLLCPEDCDWAVKQVMTSADWSAGSVFWNWASGGLNHQVEHHLFPSMCIYNYPYIAGIVKQTCAEFGLPYYNFKNYAAAHASMRNYLYELGERDVPKLAVPEEFKLELPKAKKLQESS